MRPLASLSADQSSPLITCLSGGADSTALALLAESYARQTGRQHSTTIIDHGIRPAAAQEAARTAQRMRQCGIAATIRRVTAAAPSSGIQPWARAQRYAIATADARQQGAVLLLGQHAGDQAETVWMRLHRGSGLAGLAGMRPLARRDGVVMLRPLLGFQRQELEHICQHAGVAWETDPSNADPQFERVRVRAALAGMPDMAEQLQRLSAAAGVIDDHLLQAVADAVSLVQLAPDGSAVLDAALPDLPAAVARRLLSQVIRQVGGRPHPPGSDALDRLRRRMQMRQAATLGGCRLQPAAHGQMAGHWRVMAEIGRQPARSRLPAGGRIVHDGRWLLHSRFGGIVRSFAAMPPDARDSWHDVPGWQGVPAAVRAALPVIETLDGTWVCPHLTTYGAFADDPGCGDVSAAAVFLPFAAQNTAQTATGAR